jgi:hypothetical protein
MLRVKRQATGSYTVTQTATDDDGALVTVTGPYTLKIYDGASTLLATQTPAYAASIFTANIAYTVLPKLDTYTLVWSGSVNSVATEWTTTLELVGGHIFEIADLRAMDRAFADTTKYPNALLRAVRIAVEETFESSRASQVCWVPRGRRVTLDGTAPDFARAYSPLLYGNDTRCLTVPDYEVRSVYSVSIDGTALTQQEIADIDIADNVLWRKAGVQWPSWPYGHKNIVLHYECGYDRPPAAITRAALILGREYLVKSDLPSRATATSIGDQIFRLTIAGRDGITGIPDVDAAIDQFGRKGYGIG